MPPKKGKKGKKKTEEPAEPPHDPSWERTVETGVWERPVLALPDANTWPTWGALRERVLTACKEVRICNTPSLRDAFASEVVKLSPPELQVLDLKGSSNLHNFVLSPLTSCPKLIELDLSSSENLEYVLLQSQCLRTLSLKKCTNLTKALIHCPRLNKIVITDCPNLETLMLWSEELTELDMTGCNNLVTLKLQCSILIDSKIPPLKPALPEVKPKHPPIAAMLKENYKESAQIASEAKEKEWKSLKDDSIIPHVFRPF